MDKKIESLNIIEHLKLSNLYSGDNRSRATCECVSNLDDNKPNSICWIKKSRYDLSLLKSHIILVNEDFKDETMSKTIIYTKNAQLAMTYVFNEFFKENSNYAISDKSSIDKSVKLGDNVYVGENVVIGKNCIIGSNTYIYPNCVIYPDTEIGSNVVINAGAKIGQAGFGYIKDLDGNNIQFPHIGSVIIKDNVEIGSNTCIDRGALSNTVIGEYTKINNLTHIAHNVQIGQNCLITANVNISGSVVISDNVYIGPNSAVMDGVKLLNNSTIGMGSVVRKSVESNKTLVPLPSFEKREYVKVIKKLRE